MQWLWRMPWQRIIYGLRGEGVLSGLRAQWSRTVDHIIAFRGNPIGPVPIGATGGGAVPRSRSLQGFAQPAPATATPTTITSCGCGSHIVITASLVVIYRIVLIGFLGSWPCARLEASMGGHAPLSAAMGHIQIVIRLAVAIEAAAR